MDPNEAETRAVESLVRQIEGMSLTRGRRPRGLRAFGCLKTYIAMRLAITSLMPGSLKILYR